MKIIYACLTGLGLSVTTQAAVVQWTVASGGNGHYYERVDTNATWDEANTAANSMIYNGLHGHLVTITSAGENNFITDNPDLGDGILTSAESLVEGHWIGGFQPAGSPEPDGGWTWVTGETFAYANWWPGEPNNYINEDAIMFAHGFNPGNGKAWNDAAHSSGSNGFIVEYEVVVVPEPASFVAGLSALGMLGVWVWRNRK